ncbi:STAS domain-containing protein [Uliginosibacterium gangwonense]|uniref:STAS domain-containing protein n=1 Tax=Uliginosibacterium gangwonense TaxID=392736 RepID=UPI00035EAF51|nr:STAS domain-containing protein [Uliginosibacterium gangwonense]
MVLSFFGKKPQGDSKGVGSADSGKGESTTTMDFSHIAGGDMGRALAAAADKIQVQEVTYEDVAAIEEAAILFANANEDGAKAVLEEAINGVGSQSERIWAMLFDLYRLIGDKASFDARGVAYAQAYEKSPPVWQGCAPQAAAAPARDGAPAVNLTGVLSGAARTQFEQLARIGVKMGKLKIELSRLKGIDEAGCILFNDTLAMLKQGKVKVAMGGAQQALSLLEPRLKVGEPEGRVYWQVALALMQQLGDQEKFEDMAVNYAITFEESPPSWDAPVSDPTESVVTAPEPVAAVMPPARECFILDGVVSGSQPDVVRKLAVYASEHGNMIEIDASGLQRLEFVSAGSLFNQFATLQGQGKLCVIRHPNEMVAALMRVMGIDQVAQIEYKKF